MKLYGKFLKTYFLFLAFIIPLAFIQKCEEAYYLPKLVLLFSGVVFLAPIISNIKNIKFDMMDKALLIFLAAYFTGFFKSVNKTTAFMSWLEWAMAVIMFLYCRYFLDKKDIQKVIIAIVASACLASVYALMQAFNLDLPGWITNFSGRAFSTFGNPDFFGGFLVLVMPFALLVSKNKIIVSVTAAFLLLTLFLTQTRSSIFAFLLSLLIIVLLFRNEIMKNVKYILTVLLVVAALAALTGKFSAVAARVKASGGAGDLRGRVMMWQTGLNMIEKNLITGTGIGNIKPYYAEYKKDNSGYFETEHLHNDFIDIAAQSGVIAMAFFMAIVFFGTKNLLVKGSDNSKITLAGITALLAHAFFNFPLFVLPTNAGFFMLLGLGTNMHIKAKNESKAFGAVAVILSAIILTISLRATAGSIAMNYAINSMDAGNYKAAEYYLGKAMPLYPFEKKYFHLADYYSKTGNISGTISVTEKFLEFQPYSKPGLMQAGIAYAEAKDYEKADEKFDLFLKYYPNDNETMSDKAKVLYLKGEKQPAIDLYNKILSLYPLDETAHANLMAIYNNEEMIKQMWDEKKRFEEAKNAKK